MLLDHPALLSSRSLALGAPHPSDDPLIALSSSPDPTVLVADDNEETTRRAAEALRGAGFQVETVRSGEAALQMLSKIDCILFVVDAMMPGLGGLGACKHLRGDDALCDLPVLMLVRHSSSRMRRKALEAGADAFLHKPLSKTVLISQVRALLRAQWRVYTRPARLYACDLVLDRSTREVRVDHGAGAPVRLTLQEFELLYALALCPGVVLARSELLQAAWGSADANPRTVDVHVSKVRAKIGRDYIDTVRGVGYRLRDRSLEPLPAQDADGRADTAGAAR